MNIEMPVETESNMGHSLYADPRRVANVEECFFYHTMDVPGHGTVTGDWDLRAGVRRYLGGVDFRGKRVLEVGTANGFLCFEMERLGAEVVAYDLSEDQSWDIVPYAQGNLEELLAARKTQIRRLNNGYWFAHQAHRSRARVVYGSVYDIPEEIGPVDVTTFGCVLLHVRDPFLALQRALRLTRRTVIVTEPVPRITRLTRRLRYLGLPAVLSRMSLPAAMQFLPDCRRRQPTETWWRLTPELLREFLGVLGFRRSKVTFHHQAYKGRKIQLYTIVATNTGSESK